MIISERYAVVKAETGEFVSTSSAWWIVYTQLPKDKFVFDCGNDATKFKNNKLRKSLEDYIAAYTKNIQELRGFNMLDLVPAREADLQVLEAAKADFDNYFKVVKIIVSYV